MSDYKAILISLLKRSVPAFAVGSLGWWLFGTASYGLGAVGYLLFGMACLVGVATILAPPIARLLAESSGNLFYPGRYSERPQPMYGIPQSKRAKGLYEEALAGFEQIANEYPDEVKPHIEMIDIAIVNLKNPERAAAIYLRGMELMKKEEDKEVLSKMYEAIRSRLNAKPSNK